MSGAITDVLESTAKLADHGEGADFAKTLHDEGGEPAAKRQKSSGGLWDDIVSGAQSAAGAVNNGVHALGHAAETTAQNAITTTTGAVRDVAGDGAARAFNSAAEGALNTAKQTAGFTYGVGEGAASAAGDMVKGTVDLAKSGVKFATDSGFRGQVVQGAEQLASTVAHDPVGTAKAIGSGVVNAGESWLRGAGRAAQEGNLGEYLGQGTGSAAVNIGSFFIPGADAAEAANVAAHAVEATEAVNTLVGAGSAVSEVAHLNAAGKGAGEAAGALGKAGTASDNGIAAATAASTAAEPTGQFYSVAFATKLDPASYPGVSRGAHFQEANQALLKAMEGDKGFAGDMQGLGVSMQRTETGLAPRTSPQNFTWHHAQEPGMMELVPRAQHAPGSVFQDALHPDGQGGYAIWGK